MVRHCQMCKADVVNDKEKRKKEVEDKLLVLNAKKHNLVQVLKQVSFYLTLLFCRYRIIFI